MLRDLPVLALTFDEARDVATIRAGGAIPRGELTAQVLLDGAGRFVGLDLCPDGVDRVVLLHGAHEDVARVVPARVQSDGVEVRVPGARALLGADRVGLY